MPIKDINIGCNVKHRYQGLTNKHGDLSRQDILCNTLDQWFKEPNKINWFLIEDIVIDTEDNGLTIGKAVRQIWPKHIPVHYRNPFVPDMLTVKRALKMVQKQSEQRNQ